MSATATTTAPEKGVPLGGRSLSRLIAESDLYDFKPTSRALLIAIALMTIGDEEDAYPKDAPEDYIANKIGWCWLSQWKLGLRVGISESQVNRLLDQFEDDGVIKKRYWHDEYGVLHAEYMIIKDVLIAHQRPNQERDVKRPTRYSKPRPKKGWFSSVNQPKRTAKAKSNPIAEMDEE